MEHPEILIECYECGEPSLVTRMVHKWERSLCLVCANPADIPAYLINNNTEGINQ